MRTTWLGTALAGVAVGLATVSPLLPGRAGATSIAPGSNNSCNGGFGGATFSPFTKTVSINGRTAANGESVSVGTVIHVTLSWDPANFKGQQDMILDCVATTTNGSAYTVDETRSQASMQKPVPVGESSYTTSYTVLASDAGQRVCDRGRISGVASGSNPSTEKSNIMCFAVGPVASTPEAPLTVLLPIIAAALGVGGMILVRRRNKSLR